jgi:hypothetical protein
MTRIKSVARWGLLLALVLGTLTVGASPAKAQVAPPIVAADPVTGISVEFATTTDFVKGLIHELRSLLGSEDQLRWDYYVEHGYGPIPFRQLCAEFGGKCPSPVPKGSDGSVLWGYPYKVPAPLRADGSYAVDAAYTSTSPPMVGLTDPTHSDIFGAKLQAGTLIPGIGPTSFYNYGNPAWSPPSTGYEGVQVDHFTGGGVDLGGPTSFLTFISPQMNATAVGGSAKPALLIGSGGPACDNDPGGPCRDGEASWGIWFVPSVFSSGSGEIQWRTKLAGVNHWESGGLMTVPDHTDAWWGLLLTFPTGCNGSSGYCPFELTASSVAGFTTNSVANPAGWEYHDQWAFSRRGDVPIGKFAFSGGAMHFATWRSAIGTTEARALFNYVAAYPGGTNLIFGRQGALATPVLSPTITPTPTPSTIVPAPPVTAPTPTTIATPAPPAAPAPDETNTTLGNRITDALSWLGSSITDSLGWLGGVFTSMITWLGNLLYGILLAIYNLLKWGFDAVLAKLDWLGAWLSSIYTILVSGFNLLAKTFTDMITWLGSNLMVILSTVVDKLTQLVALVVALPQLIANAIQTALSTLFVPTHLQEHATALQTEMSTHFPGNYVTGVHDAFTTVKSGVNGGVSGSACGPSMYVPAPLDRSYYFPTPSTSGCPGNGAGGARTTGDNSAGDVFGFRVVLRNFAALLVWLGFFVRVVGWAPWARDDMGAPAIEGT